MVHSGIQRAAFASQVALGLLTMEPENRDVQSARVFGCTGTSRFARAEWRPPSVRYSTPTARRSSISRRVACALVTMATFLRCRPPLSRPWRWHWFATSYDPIPYAGLLIRRRVCAETFLKQSIGFLSYSAAARISIRCETRSVRVQEGSLR